LSRSLGITVMTAATKDQKAFELKSLGHGFIYLSGHSGTTRKRMLPSPSLLTGIAESISQTLPFFLKNAALPVKSLLSIPRAMILC